ncbi:MAG: hypothetical protein SNJ57_07635 [Cyanobacteriota bacterium]
MKDSVWLLAKVMGGSALGAIAIKYLPPLAWVPPKPLVVWAIVLTPTLVMAALLGWLTWRRKESPGEDSNGATPADESP